MSNVIPFHAENFTLAEAAWLPLPIPFREELALLRAEGATEFALREVKAFEVNFFLGNFFELAKHPGDGERAFIMPIRDAREAIIDLAAWPINAPHRPARRDGRGALLGEGLIENPASFYGGEPLQIYRTATRWLANDCRGAVIIDWPGAALRLANAPAIAGEDVDHAFELARGLDPHVAKSRIFAPRPQRGAA